MHRLAFFFLCALASASAQAVITELGPAASYIPNGLPGAGVAQGSYFYIKGSNLGSSPGMLFSGPASYTIGIDLAGTRVRVTMGAVTLEAFPYFASASQVNVILPSATPVGLGTVTVFYNGEQAVFPINVVRAAYGIFTLNSAGSGPAVVTSAVTNVAATVINALHPGDRAILWGTGLGAATLADNQPAQFQRLEASVSLFVGGRAATIEYAGRTPGLSGLDQINFIVPPDLAGCAVPVVVRIANKPSNFATIPVALSGPACNDFDGISPADLAAAQARPLAVGTIAMNRFTSKRVTGERTVETRADTVTGTFTRRDFNSVIRGRVSSSAVPGSCIVSIYRGTTDPGDPQPSARLDAGAKLSFLTGGRIRDMAKADGVYTTSGVGEVVLGETTSAPNAPGTQGPFLEPGSFTITGQGGADVGAFAANVAMPDPLVWVNQDATTSVGRSQDLRILWTGGSASELVVISGAAVDERIPAGGNFTCYESAAAGEFTVPSYVLSALPASSSAGDAPLGFLAVGRYAVGARFNAPGLNYGVVTYSVNNKVTLSYE